MMNADGSSKQERTFGQLKITDDAPAWSPDGELIAFVRGQRVFTVEATGSQKPIVADLSRMSKQDFDLEPQWSADGRQLAFLRWPGKLHPARTGLDRDDQTLATGAPTTLRSRTSVMGRAGIEPATLGLKVRAELMRRGAADGNVLQPARVATAPNCNELRVAEASPYSNPYSAMLLSRGRE